MISPQEQFGEIIIAPITSANSKQRSALRLSGNNLPELCLHLFKDIKTNTYHFEKANLTIPCESVLLNIEILLLCMPKNLSFTHEPVIEIHYPSNEKISTSILEFFYSLGVRPALPGEFTKRAYLNGRLSIEQANSIAALISAQDIQQRSQALRISSGNQTSFFKDIKEHLFLLRRNLEAIIDFPEEPDIDHKQFVWSESIQSIDNCLKKQSNDISEDTSHQYLQIAIIGPANAGKSSLIKTLIPGSTPIVSHLPGTTLDLIPYQFHLNNFTLILYDSPGLKDIENYLDTLSLNNLSKRIHDFDALIFLDSESQFKTPPWLKIEQFTYFIKVSSKYDLIHNHSSESLSISSLTGYGILQFKKTLLKWAQDFQKKQTSPWKALENRIANIIQQKYQIIKDRLLIAEDEEELAAYDLDELLEELDSVLYQEGGNEALLDSIFKNFCIGK